MAAVVVVLAVANVLNNVVAPSAYVLTSMATTAVLLLVLRWCGGAWADAGLERRTLPRGVRWGLVLAAVVAVCYAAAALLPATRELFLDVRVTPGTPATIIYQVLVRVPLGTVLLEEVAFRGVLYGLVDRRYGSVWAIVVSSALFGLWHILPAMRLVETSPVAGMIPGADRGLGIVAGVVAAMLAGAILCELRRRTGGLIAGVGVHWATNALGYVTAYLVIRSG